MPAHTLLAEIMLDGVWTNVTQYVTQQPITITRGRPNEAGKVTPSVCALTLKDDDGRFTSKNPLSPYYGKLGRNTPIRIKVNGVQRFYGFTAKITPAWDLTHRYRVQNIEAGGELRRLATSRPAEATALQRFIEGTSPTFYWPMEDGSASSPNLYPAVGPLPFIVDNPNGDDPAQQLGRGTLAAWMRPALGTGKDLRTVATEHLPIPSGVTRFAVGHVRTGGRQHNNLTVFTLNTSWIIQFSLTTNSLRLTAFGATVSAATVPKLFDGLVHHVHLTATQSGANIGWLMYVDGAVVDSGTIVAQTVTGIDRLSFQDVITHPNDPLVLGHTAAWYGTPPNPVDLGKAALGYPGEPAGRRLERLCAQEAITFSSSGSLDDTELMGPQPPLSIAKLFEECVDTDRGTLYEPRTGPGLKYRTRASLYNQAAVLTLNYAGRQVAPPLAPVEDDQLIRNSVTAKGRYGGSARSVQSTGPLNVQKPEDDPQGVGTYEASPSANVHAIGQLTSIAEWTRHTGTIDEPRFPVIRVDLNAPDVDAPTAAAAVTVDVDDLIVVTGLTAVNVYDDVRQLARGYVETLDTAYKRSIAFNCAPASAFDAFTLEHDTLGRLHPEGQTLQGATPSSAGSIRAAAPLGLPQWSTQTPYDLKVSGARLRVTAVSNTRTFIGVGAAAHGNHGTQVTPPLHASTQPGDLILCLAAARNSGAGTPVLPGGYALAAAGDTANAKLFVTLADTGETGPPVSFLFGVFNGDTSAQCATFRGFGSTVMAAATQLNASAQNIAVPAASWVLPVTEALVVRGGWKQDDWTSVAPIAGMTEIAEAVTTVGDDQGIVWDYEFISGATPFNSVAASTFVVTGGVAAISRGIVAVFAQPSQGLTATLINGVSKTMPTGSPIELFSDHVIAA